MLSEYSGQSDLMNQVLRKKRKEVHFSFLLEMVNDVKKNSSGRWVNGSGGQARALTSS